MSWYGLGRFPTTGDEKVGEDSLFFNLQDEIKPLLNAPSGCIACREVPDRIGTELQYYFNRRKARRIIQRWIQGELD